MQARASRNFLATKSIEPDCYCQGVTIVVDGRTDYEKLVELLGLPEQTHLDFKAKVDLTRTEDKVKFVKDAVSMSNRPPGGYILVGVDDGGHPCLPIGSIPDRRRFDGAQLDQLVRRYIEGETHIAAQIHEHQGNEIVVVYVPHHRDGLPVPMSKDGQWELPTGKKQTEFREGEVIVREGAANVALRHAHWLDLLSVYTERVRAEASALANELLRAFVEQRADARAEPPGGTSAVPLLVEMDNSSFAEAVGLLAEAGQDTRVRRFLRTLKEPIVSGSLEQCQAALDKWTIVVAQALDFERPDLAGTAIELLYDAYQQIPVAESDAVRKRLAAVVRLYAVGSLMVRLSAWSTLRQLVLRRVLSPGYDDYWYSSWIRQGQVEASRANLLPDDGPDNVLISSARKLAADHSAMRPDLDPVPPAGEAGVNDPLLDSICQFDFAYCLIVAIDGHDNGGFYPSSAMLHEYRTRPLANKVSSQPEVRAELLPNATDADVAEALEKVYEFASREALRLTGDWWDAPPQAQRFIDHHRGAPTTG